MIVNRIPLRIPFPPEWKRNHSDGARRGSSLRCVRSFLRACTLFGFPRIRTMRIARLLFVLLFSLAVFAQEPIILDVSTALDGRGRVLRDVRIVVEKGNISRILAAKDAAKTQAGGRLYDLRGLTVLPAWIDTHVHIGWHFGPNGRAADANETPQQAAPASEANAWATLQAGFTTVQSLGAPADKDLRDAIARGALPGPRILAAMQPLSDGRLTPEQ